MTRLENYLNEAVLKGLSVEDVQDILLKDCKKFLKETSWAFYRGSDAGWGQEGSIHRIKSRAMVGKHMRKPKDTPIWIHKMANKAFKETHGWSPRQGVFASDMGTAASYGKGTFLFFPIGNYDYLWSPSVRDFFATGLDAIGPAKYGGNKIDIFVGTLYQRVEWWAEESGRPSFSQTAEWQPYYKHFYLGNVKVSKSSVQKYIYDKLLEVTKLYTDTDLERAAKKNAEASFRVKEYYLVPGDFQLALTTSGFNQLGNWARRA